MPKKHTKQFKYSDGVIDEEANIGVDAILSAASIIERRAHNLSVAEQELRRREQELSIKAHNLSVAEQELSRRLEIVRRRAHNLNVAEQELSKREQELSKRAHNLKVAKKTLDELGHPTF